MAPHRSLVGAALGALLLSACTGAGVDRSPRGGAGGGEEEQIDAAVTTPRGGTGGTIDARVDTASSSGGDARVGGSDGTDAAVDGRTDAGSSQDATAADTRAPDAGAPDTGAPAVRFAEIFEVLGIGACAGCHDGHIKDRVNLSGNEQTVYGILVNKKPLLGSAACRSQTYVVPGKPEQSLLYQLVLKDGQRAGCAKRMPPGDPLTDQQTEVIRSWIASGALR